VYRLTKVVIDTSVIIEYIDLKGKYHKQATSVFSAISSGKIQAIIPHPILTESYYVSSRIYQQLNIGNPEIRAQKLIKWLYTHPTIIIPNIGLKLAIEAGDTKQRYGLALTDCYVLAASRIYNCKALFTKREKEMLKKIDDIKREYNVIFLEDYA